MPGILPKEFWIRGLAFQAARGARYPWCQVYTVLLAVAAAKEFWIRGLRVKQPGVHGLPMVPGLHGAAGGGYRPHLNRVIANNGVQIGASFAGQGPMYQFQFRFQIPY